MKYEVEGKVKVSGEWYSVIGTGPNSLTVATQDSPHVGTSIERCFIEDYISPKPEPYNWLKKIWDNRGIVSEMNQYLTDTYGDPTERVYRGEKAEEFGLSGTDSVLYWMRGLKNWTSLSFCYLKEGALWRKMPNRITPIEQ